MSESTIRKLAAFVVSISAIPAMIIALICMPFFMAIKLLMWSDKLAEEAKDDLCK